MTDPLTTQLAALDPARSTEVPEALRATVVAQLHAAPAPDPAPSRRLRPRRRILPLGLFAALLVASGAVAAAVAIHAGAPVPKTPQEGAPIGGPGDPLAGSVRLLPIRAADPDGGLPWGIRTYRTGRDAECWQIGRVLGDHLGLLGQDGDLGDDGLFHALPVEPGQCRPLDGAGHLYAFQNTLALASGTPNEACYRGSRIPVPHCDPRDQRIVWHGFLGPEARSVTVDGGGPTIAVRPEDEGVWMYVQRIDVLARSSGVQTFTATYADGTKQPVDDVMPMETVSNGPPRGTTPPGYVAPEETIPAPSRVRARVDLTTAHQGRNRVYRVRFRAPVSTRRYGLEYSVHLDAPAGGRRCDEPMHFAGFNPPGTVHAGQRITIDMTPAIQFRWNRGWCPGTYRGRVVLHDRAHTVGTFGFTVPR